MRDLPKSWTRTTDGFSVEDPDAFLILTDASWPPATESTPAGMARATSWSVTREVATTLPGSASGASVAEGAATIDQVSTDPVAPWRLDGRTVTVDDRATVELRAGGPSGEPFSLGRFRVDEASGSLRSGDVTVKLLEDVGTTAGPVTLPVLIDFTGREPVDASWTIDYAARALGFYSTPRPAPGCVLSVPMRGSAVPEVGTDDRVATVDGQAWTTYDGQVAPVAAYIGAGCTANLDPTTTQPYVTFTLHSGPVVMAFGSIAIRVTETTIQVATYTENFAASTTVNYVLHPSRRVQVQVRQTVNVTAETYTATEARIRSGEGTAWSLWAYNAESPGFEGSVVAQAVVNGMGSLTGLQITTVDSPELWAATNAIIAASGVMQRAVFAEPVEPWTLIQRIADGTFGAAWVRGDGVFVYRDRHTMRGVADLARVIDVDLDLDDLPWSVDRDSTSTGVELTHTPPDIQAVTNYSITVWQATEVVAVPAGKSVTIVADLEAAVADLGAWSRDTVPTNATTGSRWLASTSRTGGGTLPEEGALAVHADLVSPTQARITVRNTTSTTLYTCDGTGAAWLILRANTTARPGEAQVVTVGNVTGPTARVRTADVGTTVQDTATALALATWLADVTARPTVTVSDVALPLDLRIELGDVVSLRAEGAGVTDYDPRIAKALVTGVTLDGGDGGITQSVSLVLLPIVHTDLDRLLKGATFATLDVLWATMTFADVDRWITQEGIPT